MTRKILLPLAVLLCALACTPETDKDPTVFIVTSTSSTYSPLQQTMDVVVLCDRTWSAAFQDGSWATVTGTSYDGSLTGGLTVGLSRNDGPDARRDTLVITSGNLARKFGFEQGGLSSLLSPLSVTLRDTGPETITVFAPTAWTAAVTSGSDWFSVSPTSGAVGSATATVTPRDANLNVGARTGAVRFTFDGASVDIPVTQGQKDVIILSDKTVRLGYAGGGFTVTTGSNVSYAVSVTADWITHVSGTKALNSMEEVFSVAANGGSADRWGTVLFSDGTLTESMTVYQEARDPVLDQTVYGAYGIGGSDRLYAAGDQLCRSHASGRVVFRILTPADNRVAEVSGIPSDAAVGDSFTVTYSVRQGKSATSADYAVTVSQADGSRLWLKVATGSGFIVKK